MKEKISPLLFLLIVTLVLMSLDGMFIALLAMFGLAL